MSARLFRCPSCDAEIESGPFCKFCGSPVDTPIESPVEDIESSVVIDFGSISLGSDIDELTPLLAHAELDIINAELEDIIEQTRATRQALKLENVDKRVLSGKAEGLRALFDKLKERKDLLLQAPTQLMIEILLNELSSVELKSKRLEEASDTLEKDALKEQREKLKKERKRLRDKIKHESKTLSVWTKEFKKKKRTLVKDLGKLDAKFKIGEISRTAYDTSHSEMIRSIKLLEESLSRLDEMQLVVKSKT